MLNYFRRNLIRSLIKRKKSNQVDSGKPVSLREAKNIGLLAMIESEDDLHQLIDFGETLKSYGPKVKGLAYVSSGRVPGYFKSQNLFGVITTKDVNLAGIPGGNKVSDFLDEQYDFLIDLTMRECLPLLYISGISVAGIKAGRYNTNSLQIYDFMIKEEGGNKFGDFLHSMKKYLSKINTTRA